jgi:hypothetical protein
MQPASEPSPFSSSSSRFIFGRQTRPCLFMGKCARPTGSYYARGHGSKRSPGERSDSRDCRSRISRSLSSGAHSRDPVAHAGYQSVPAALMRPTNSRTVACIISLDLYKYQPIFLSVRRTGRTGWRSTSPGCWIGHALGSQFRERRQSRERRDADTALRHQCRRPLGRTDQQGAHPALVSAGRGRSPARRKVPAQGERGRDESRRARLPRISQPRGNSAAR